MPSTPVIGWGQNTDGQTTIPTGAQTDVTAIASESYAHSLALKLDGSVLGWGSNTEGQTTIPTAAQSGVTAIAGGFYHSLAVDAGAVIGWGRNTEGETTIPTAAQSGVSAVASGGYHSLALKTDGSVLGWGRNTEGQTTIPTGAQTNVTAIAGGFYHSLALKTNGSVIGWGRNSEGQTTIPTAAQTGVIAIAAGGYFSLALKINGSVIGWGQNSSGQTTIPTAAQSGVTAIAAGGFHGLAVKAGVVTGWGRNTEGQTIIPTAAQTGISDVAGGYYFSLAVKPPPNQPPVANFTVSGTGGTRTFTDTSTDPDGTIASRAWDFGDGSTSTVTNPSKTWTTNGTYTVLLTVTDNGGVTGTKSQNVIISNQTPVASFTVSGTGATRTFTDTSTDPDGTIVSRAWDFGDGSTSTATNPSKTWASSATYTVMLAVTDNGGVTAKTSQNLVITVVKGLKVTVSVAQETLVPALVKVPVALPVNKSYSWSARVYCEVATGMRLDQIYLRESAGAMRTVAPAGTTNTVTTLPVGYTDVGGTGFLPTDWNASSELVLRPARKADNTAYDSTKWPRYNDLVVEEGTSTSAWTVSGEGNVARFEHTSPGVRQRATYYAGLSGVRGQVKTVRQGTGADLTLRVRQSDGSIEQRRVLVGLTPTTNVNLDLSHGGAGTERGVVMAWGSFGVAPLDLIGRFEDLDLRKYPGGVLRFGVIEESLAGLTWDVHVDDVQVTNRGLSGFEEHDVFGRSLGQVVGSYHPSQPIRQDLLLQQDWERHGFAVVPGQTYVLAVQARADNPTAVPARLAVAYAVSMRGGILEVADATQGGVLGQAGWSDFVSLPYVAPQDCYKVVIGSRDVGAGEYILQRVVNSPGSTPKRTGKYATAGSYDATYDLQTPNAHSSASAEWARVRRRLDAPVRVPTASTGLPAGSVVVSYRSGPTSLGPFSAAVTDPALVPEGKIVRVGFEMSGNVYSTPAILPGSPHVEYLARTVPSVALRMLLDANRGELPGGAVFTRLEDWASIPSEGRTRLPSGKLHDDPTLFEKVGELPPSELYLFDPKTAKHLRSNWRDLYVVEADGEALTVKLSAPPEMERLDVSRPPEFGAPFVHAIYVVQLPACEVIGAVPLS